MSQAGKRRRSADVARFADEVAAAYAAFTVDVSYAVAMARAATTIARKRRVWQARRDAKTAEVTAHHLCRSAGAFQCAAISPCGTEDCKFAAGEMAVLTGLGDCAGITARPQPSNRNLYTIEAAVAPLASLRATSR